MEFKLRFDKTEPSDADLCKTCKYLNSAHGHSMNEEIRSCGYLDVPLKWRVATCNKFYPANLPTKNDMEEIAWVLVTKGTGRQMGFMRVKDMSFEQRKKYDVD